MCQDSQPSASPGILAAFLFAPGYIILAIALAVVAFTETAADREFSKAEPSDAYAHRRKKIRITLVAVAVLLILAVAVLIFLLNSAVNHTDFR